MDDGQLRSHIENIHTILKVQGRELSELKAELERHKELVRYYVLREGSHERT